MTSYVRAELRRLVESRARRLCEYCLIHEDDTYLGCQVDHIIAMNWSVFWSDVYFRVLDGTRRPSRQSIWQKAVYSQSVRMVGRSTVT